MKRKLPVLLMLILMAALLVTPAFADVIWEPDNSFYSRNRDDCTYHDRAYLTNGEKGYVTVETAPGSLVEVLNIANGTRFFVQFIWTDKDGSQWGVGYPAGDREHQGWVPMEQMALIYDYVSFQEDHGAEFTEYDGSVAPMEQACLYAWPGGVYSYTMEFETDYMTSNDAFQTIYTDGNGLRWAFIGYYMGHRDGWVCIDDPMNENLGVDGYLTVAQVRGESQTLVEPSQPPEAEPTSEPSTLPEIYPTETIYPPAEKVPQARTWLVFAIPAALILVVVVVTALIVRSRKKRSLTD